MLISLQILVESFVSNIIIDLSYNLSKYIQYKHVGKLFEVGCLHQHAVANRIIALYRLNGKLLKFLWILITAVYFKDLKWISKTMYCISCLLFCKITFCSECPDTPDEAGRETRWRRRRRTQAISKRYAFHANAKINLFKTLPLKSRRKLLNYDLKIYFVAIPNWTC